MTCSKHSLFLISTVTGVFLLLLPVGVYWYWGNMAVYIVSYYHRKYPTSTDYDTSWPMFVQMFCRGPMFVISGFLIKLIGQRKTICLGITIFNVGIMGNYFVVNGPFWLWNVTMGALSGIGGGLVYGPSFYSAVQWSTKSNIGLITAIIQCGNPFGAIVMNQFTTIFLNPDNQRPNGVFNQSRFFLQTSILNRVPRFFFVLGCSFIVIQLLGICLLRDNPQKEDEEDKELIKKDSEEEAGSFISRKSQNVDENPKCVAEHTPKQLFRSWAFYLLIMACVLSEYNFLIAINYYKTFGQVWIRDDYFLTAIGTVTVILTIPIRVLCGLFIDRIGVKGTVVTGMAVLSISGAFMYASALLNRWMYLTLATLLGSVAGAFDNAFTVAQVIYFGRKHSVVNAGLLNLMSLGALVIAPPILDYLVKQRLWSVVFFSGSSAALFSIIMTILFLPQK